MKLFTLKSFNYFVFVAVSVATVFSGSCSNEQEIKTEITSSLIVSHDYDSIVAEGVIRATVEYNSTDFYVNGDTLSGFHYELLNLFAKEKNLKVEIIPEMSFEKRIRNLNDGKCDIIAYGMAATNELKDSLLLTVPLMLSKSVLVQRKPNEEDPSSYIESLLDLSGKTIHLVKGSPSIMRIRNLEVEIGDNIYIEEIDKYGSEQLMAMVAHGDIDYVVCDEHIARASTNSLSNLDIHTDVSFNQFYSWGVGKQSPILHDSLNIWLLQFRITKQYKELYNKYYN
ncbi:glutamine ABC transporter substrate-binding protein [termite gut metagenome]|uniref:Glutamine ABC transporter substrate-binding protein n=1 Tax=termite gut metagenome TaxID=433724 RepID=A0A5J4SQT1_9ZZZZ